MNEKISLIERYAEDLTKKVYYADPAIARENEIKQMILILFTPEKSPILVGKPGIGKTAIVSAEVSRVSDRYYLDLIFKAKEKNANLV